MASPFYIKLWNEILDDPKMGFLPDNVWRRCIELFMFAGELYLDGQLPDTAHIAYRLHGLNPDALQAELEQLEQVGVLEQNEQGWFIIAFAERQRARTSTERSQLRRQREARTEPAELYGLTTPETEPQPPRNDDATDVQPVCNDDATKSCTDIDIDKKRLITTTTCARAEESLATFYQNETGKSPKGITDNERWVDDCGIILDLAGGDPRRAEGLVSEALVILEELNFSHNGPGSLIKTIRRQLQKKHKKRVTDGKYTGNGGKMGKRRPEPTEAEIQAQLTTL